MFDKAVEFLYRCQEQDGSFISLSSPSSECFDNSLKLHSVFSTALIVQILSSFSENVKVASINKRALTFLLSQKTKYWTWNYWNRNSKESEDMPYPDDLDDTFCALTSIYLCEPSIIGGKVLGTITQLLTSMEENIGGPYRTWIVSNDAEKIWKDVDVVVNANIANFLDHQHVTLPQLTRMFTYSLKQKQYSSPYYPTPFPFFYFLSRFVRGKKWKELLTSRIIEELSKSKQTPLDVALCLTSLLRLNYKEKELIHWAEFLIKSQKENGSWDVSTFYTGVNPKRDKKYYAGSYALSTAYCLEALTAYNKCFSIISKKNHVFYNEAHDMRKNIIKEVESRFLLLSDQIREESLSRLRYALDNDSQDQIILLPFIIRKSLGKKGNIIPDQMIIKLGAASVYGWIAYTIYDDVLDQEGKISLLPVANICLRELSTIFCGILPLQSGFQLVFNTIIDKMEEANLWEVTNTRFNRNDITTTIPNYGDYKNLAYRSMGHALGAIALLLCIGFSTKSKEVKYLVSFFTNLLIARQLNDDAHDWEKDYNRGQINSVCSLLLNKTQVRNSSGLQLVFWNDVVEDVCVLIEKYLYKAERIMDKMDVFENKQLLYSFIHQQKQSVEQTKKERGKVLDFLNMYV